MSYSLLYEAWKIEKETQELQPLDKEFHLKLSQQIKNQLEELEMLDNKTLKAYLIQEEKKRIKKLLTDLVRSRYVKIFKEIVNRNSISMDILTVEEEKIYSGISSTWEYLEKGLNSVLRGKYSRATKAKGEDKPKRILIRVLKAIPAIVGPEMKTYGPFKEEDVVSLPAENAKTLLQRGFAKRVEVR